MTEEEQIKNLINKLPGMISTWSNDAWNDTNTFGGSMPHEHYSEDDDKVCSALKKLNDLTLFGFDKSYTVAENDTGQGDVQQIDKLANLFDRQKHDYLTHDNSEERYEDSIPTTFNKSELIDMAYDELEENAGWWDPADADNNEEAKDYRQKLNDIHKTEDLLDKGKLEDPYDSINSAYDDYHSYLQDSDDSDFDDGARGKQIAINKLDALCNAVD